MDNIRGLRNSLLLFEDTCDITKEELEIIIDKLNAVGLVDPIAPTELRTALNKENMS